MTRDSFPMLQNAALARACAVFAFAGETGSGTPAGDRDSLERLTRVMKKIDADGNGTFETNKSGDGRQGTGCEFVQEADACFVVWPLRFREESRDIIHRMNTSARPCPFQPSFSKGIA